MTSVSASSLSPKVILPLATWKRCSIVSTKGKLRAPSVQAPSQTPEAFAGTTQK
jgi:hypothetical protein